MIKNICTRKYTRKKSGLEKIAWDVSGQPFPRWRGFKEKQGHEKSLRRRLFIIITNRYGRRAVRQERLRAFMVFATWLSMIFEQQLRYGIAVIL
jgi:hypothetical protein